MQTTSSSSPSTTTTTDCTTNNKHQSNMLHCQLFSFLPNYHSHSQAKFSKLASNQSLMESQPRPAHKTKSHPSIYNKMFLYSYFALVLILTIHDINAGPSRGTLVSGAVVRPTIFSDMPQQSQQETASMQIPNSVTQAAGGSQQQQPSETTATSIPSTKPLQSSPILADGPNGNSNGNSNSNNNNLNANSNNNNNNNNNNNIDNGALNTNPGAQQSSVSTRISPLKSRFCTNANGVRLDQPLGLYSFGLDDLSFSASSYSNEQAGPQMARLNRDIAGGAWCPVKPISSSNFGKEWIQVKLNRSIVVTAIETQGRFGLGSGKEFMPNYQVEYSRNGGLTWHKWRDLKGMTLLRGNDDVNTAVKNELSPPIVGANAIRILPYSQHLRTVCMRFEIHGCQYDEGAPIAYSSPDGVVEMPRWGHLVDYTYDGFKNRGQISGGLGQLVDGVKGADNFSFNNGFEWVGWKSMNGDVVIEFAFKTLRNFTGALFHSNNLFSSGVEVFQAVDVHYGIDVISSLEPLSDSLREQRRREALQRSAGQVQPVSSAELIKNANQPAEPAYIHAPNQDRQTLWSNDPLSIEYEPDKKSEAARPVTVHLKQRLANRLRFVLKFASKWILVSEVEFSSHPVELMSLQSVSEQSTAPIIEALAPSRSYDEYVAILREHQLRRIATDAYFGLVTNSPTSSAVDVAESSVANKHITSSMVDGSPNGELETRNEDTLNSKPNSQSEGSTYAAPNQDQNPTIYRQSPWTTQWVNAGRQSDPNVLPATNPLLNSPYHMSSGPTSNSFPGAYLNQQQQSQIASANTGGLLESNLVSSQASSIFELQQRQASSNAQQQQQQQLLQQQQQQLQHSSPALGLTTVISLVLVSVVVVLSLLFIVARYRLHRHQPKLGFPNLHFGSSANSVRADAPIKGLVSPLMSVFSASNNNNNQLTLEQQHSIYHNTADYNARFSSRALPNGTMRNTLGRLAAMTNGKQHSFGQHTMQQQPGQLLVSAKANGGHQSVSTQLIVGLNQANPLAQQQIYNNSSNINCSNQTYATNYTGSMSMASSSTTTGNQGDYNEYAIPDVNSSSLGIQVRPGAAIGNGGGGGGGDLLRSSCRPTNHMLRTLAVGAGNNLTMIQSRLGQQQQQQQQQQSYGPSEHHNYEPVYQDANGQQQAQLVHSRSASGQMIIAGQHAGEYPTVQPTSSGAQLVNTAIGNNTSSRFGGSNQVGRHFSGDIKKIIDFR